MGVWLKSTQPDDGPGPLGFRDWGAFNTSYGATLNVLPDGRSPGWSLSWSYDMPLERGLLVFQANFDF